MAGTTGMTPETLAQGAGLNGATWADFVARLHHDCIGEGVSRHFTRDALFVVEAKKHTYGIDQDHGAEKVACIEDTVCTSPADYYNDHLDDDERAELDAACQEERGKPFLELGDQDRWSILSEQDNVTVTGRIEDWEFVCAHLTRDAADAFIARKKHDYEELRVNVSAQICCWEFNAIKDAILQGRLVLADLGTSANATELTTGQSPALVRPPFFAPKDVRLGACIVFAPWYIGAPNKPWYGLTRLLA